MADVGGQIQQVRRFGKEERRAGYPSEQLRKLSFFEKAKGFLSSPSETFEAVKQESLGAVFRYFLIALLIFAGLTAVVFGVFLSGFFTFIWGLLTFFGAPGEFVFFGAGAIFAGAIFLTLFLGGLLGIFVGGLWVHLWVYLLGGRGGVRQTLKAIM